MIGTMLDWWLVICRVPICFLFFWGDGIFEMVQKHGNLCHCSEFTVETSIVAFWWRKKNAWTWADFCSDGTLRDREKLCWMIWEKGWVEGNVNVIRSSFKLVQVLGSIYVNTLHKDVVTCNNNECPLFSALGFVVCLWILECLESHLLEVRHRVSVFQAFDSHPVTFPKSWT